jgi:hypothetical protein
MNMKKIPFLINIVLVNTTFDLVTIISKEVKVFSTNMC